MALSKERVVLLSVVASLFLVTVALYWFVGTYSTMFSKGPTRSALLPEVQTESDNDVQLTYNPLPLHEAKTGIETKHYAIEAMHQRLVVLTAFSSNHFIEALDMIGSVQKYLSHAKIIVYDLGLTAEERENVSKFCNAELRSFSFSKYPPHVKRNILNYAWKPLILQEVVDEEYDVILYGDASLRVTSHKIFKALRCLRDFPFLDVKPSRASSVMSVTHDKMIQYFQFPPSRQYMAHWRPISASAWFLLVNDLTRQKLIAPWVDCALHEECIAPEGAVREHCETALKLHADDKGTYVGCHRYDQSALNIILAKNFGLNVWNKAVKKDITSQVATVVKHPQGIYAVKHYPHCSHRQASA